MTQKMNILKNATHKTLIITHKTMLATHGATLIAHITSLKIPKLTTYNTHKQCL